MSIPFFNKLKVIRQVARRIDETYLSTPGQHTRGTILAVEGDDAHAVDGVMTSLFDILQRSGEFDVRCMSGPASPRNDQCDFKDYMSEILQWHEKSKHMTDFITGIEYTRNSSTPPTQTNTVVVMKQEHVTLDEEMDSYSSSSTSEGEILEGQRKESHDSKRQRARAVSAEQSNETILQTIPIIALPTSTNNLRAPTSTSLPTKSPKIPLLIINNHILHATNVWSSSIPITDSYSPVDQWRWFASLWRGIIGADVTVYIKSLGTGDGDQQEKKKGVGKMPAAIVEIKEEFGTIVVRQDAKRVDDSAVRRVAFEVGEWVRRTAGGVGEERV